MTNQEIAYIIHQYTPLLDQPEEYNTRINWGQMQRYFQCVGAKDYVSLRPFKIIRGENGVPALHFANGQCTLPADYQNYQDNMYYLLDGKPIRVHILEDKDYENFKTSPIEYPTAKFPIANIQSNYIRLLPRNIHFAVFSYFKKPTKAVYAVDSSFGYAKYDSINSVNLQWDETNQVAIIILVLQSLGIQATAEDIKNRTK